MLIKALSEKTGASIRSIRHYESRGLIQSERLPNGYRNYNANAIFTVKTIQLYLGLGLTTEHIAKIINCPLEPQTNRPICKELYKLYTEKLEQVTVQIQILQQVHSQLAEKITEFERSAAEI
jgi:DNA-binding transcriptional MerR regulator